MSEQLVLFREDMYKNSKENIKFESINVSHFNYDELNRIRYAHVVVFIDDDGKTKIIKNRFGDTGIVSGSLKKMSIF